MKKGYWLSATKECITIIATFDARLAPRSECVIKVSRCRGVKWFACCIPDKSDPKRRLAGASIIHRVLIDDWYI